MLKNLALLLAFVFFGSAATAQPSPFIPDSTWGQYGIAKPNTNSPTISLHQFQGSVLQPDGKLILAGNGNFQNSLELVRFDTSGRTGASLQHCRRYACHTNYPQFVTVGRMKTKH